MTTAHKPTFHPAVGSAHQGGYRYLAPKAQKSARDLPGQLDMKVRQIGQNSQSELESKDFRAILERKEREYEENQRLELERRGLAAPGSTSSSISTAAIESSDGTLKKGQSQLAIELAKAKLEEFDDSDESFESDSDSGSDDLDSEEELLRELEQVRQEKAEQRQREEQELKETREKEAQQSAALSNPLLRDSLSSAASVSGLSETSSQSMRRNWTEDTLFRNQAMPDRDRKPQGFVNDTTRSEFHRKFLKRYVR